MGSCRAADSAGTTRRQPAVYDYLDLWSWDGTLDRLHEALYVKCREQASREASPGGARGDHA